MVNEVLSGHETILRGLGEGCAAQTMLAGGGISGVCKTREDCRNAVPDYNNSKEGGLMRKLLIILTVILAGCSASQWNERLSTKEDRALAEGFIAALQFGNVDRFKPQIDPKLYADTAQIQDKVKAMMPTGVKPELITVNSNSTIDAGRTTTTKALNYQLGSGQKWAMVQVILQQAEGPEQIVGWHVTPSNIRPTAAGDFSFEGHGAIQFFWLAAMIVMFAISLTSAVLAFRSKGIRYRWFWTIGSLFGFIQFSLNWSTGQWGVRPVAFMLLSAAALRPSPFESWILSFCIPVVAIIFLVMRSRLVRQARNSMDQSEQMI